MEQWVPYCTGCHRSCPLDRASCGRGRRYYDEWLAEQQWAAQQQRAANAWQCPGCALGCYLGPYPSG